MDVRTTARKLIALEETKPGKTYFHYATGGGLDTFLESIFGMREIEPLLRTSVPQQFVLLNDGQIFDAYSGSKFVELELVEPIQLRIAP